MPDPESPTRNAKPGHFILKIAAAVILTFLFYVGFNSILNSFTHESTDDAFLDAHLINIASKLPGYVSAVHAVENQTVKAGDLLLEIDSRDYETKLQQKRAAAESSRANFKTVQSTYHLVTARVETAQSNRKQVQADLAATEAAAIRAQADLERGNQLRAKNVISPQEFDTLSAAGKTANANLAAAREKLTGEDSKINESIAQKEAAKTMIEVARAQLNQSEIDIKEADLDLSYMKIVAPQDGRITRKAVERGSYVQTGQTLMVIVTPHVWVTANFKESQLRLMRPGQPAEIEIDAYPDKKYQGHVDSIQSGSGARFSLLPPENAVGNFVKVVQRVPVKIVFDEPIDSAGTLGPGMSVSPSVLIRTVTVAKPIRWLVAAVLAVIVVMGGSLLFSRVKRSKSTAPAGNG
ncbi:MAG: hlyD fusE [Verrucomicrobiales bacterium]|nr:hlyD fusE [Verrucomicrobiales bacterium]